MKRIYLFSFIFSCFFCFNLFSQSYSFKNYSIAEGLAQTQVTAITEDENGYLWIGTLGGLSRFNGSTFTNFSSDDGLINNRITALYQDKKGLWIGHESGVSLYHNKTFKKWSIKKENINVTDIVRFHDKIIFSTFGEGLFIIDDFKLKQIKFKEEDQNVVRKMELINGILYIGTRIGVYYSNDLKKFNLIQNSNEDQINVSSIKKANNNLYISSIEGKIFYYNIKEKNLALIYKYQEMTFSKQFLIDGTKTWITNSLGLTLIEKNKDIEIINTNKGLPHNALNTIFKDRNGTYWIGSDGKGLFRFAGTQVKYFNKRNGIQSDLVTSSNQQYNKMIFGTYDQGLIYYQKNQFISKTLPNNTIWTTIVDENQNLWIGTNNGLFKIDKNNTLSSFALNSKITSFYKESKDKIWVGGSNGLNLIKNNQFIEDSTKRFNSGSIRSLIKYKNELICATDAGLLRYKNGFFELINHFNKRISSLKKDENNKLWIGTEEGLFCFDGKNILPFKLGLEPASKFINFIDYKDFHLFVGTNNGIYSIEIKNKNKVYHFGLDEGLINLETNINSSFFDSKGDFWFGTAEGLMLFKTNFLKQKKNPIPFLNISTIKINYENLDENILKNNTDKNNILSLNLPYNKNNIIVELDGVLLKKYKTLFYEYWLEGLDQTWSPAFTNQNLTLSNLPSGEYILHIRAKNSSNYLSKEYILKINIHPIFYKTWWFILILIGLISFLISFIFKVRINREKRERYNESLEFKAKLLTLEQQTLNASMNRHFIFNSLNSIQYFINTQDKLSANKFLSNFAKLIRKNLDSSAEDGGLVTLQEEIERLELYLSLEEMRFKDRFTFHIKIDLKIDLESIKIPAMLLQPFVENSVIHGVLPLVEKKGEILISIFEENNILLIYIDDNGVGIENSLNIKGLKKGDHKSQGTEITAKRIAILNKINKQNYEIEGPFQLYDKNSLIKGTRVLIKIMLKNLENQF
jgi:ligand-binding sensor domain-containing protein